MITAYVEGISTFMEGEDIEINYIALDESGEVLFKDHYFADYEKPAVTDHAALLDFFDRLHTYNNQDVTVFINNPALLELLNGTSTTKDKLALNTTVNVQRKIKKLGNPVEFIDISQDAEALKTWHDKLAE